MFSHAMIIMSFLTYLAKPSAVWINRNIHSNLQNYLCYYFDSVSFQSGRLTLTNYALYFGSGVGLYDKAVRYDLATDSKQVIKPELTGPLGARLFDKAVMYKSTSMYVL